jgi:hypothetical protein
LGVLVARAIHRNSIYSTRSRIYAGYVGSAFFSPTAVRTGSLAILVSRDKLRQHRRGVLIALEDWMYTNAPKKPLPSFEVARIKYELSPGGGAPAAASLERDDIAGRAGPT